MATIPGPFLGALWVDDITSVVPNPFVRSTTKLKWQRQTGNTVAGNISNSGLGVVGLPALTNGSTTTFTLSDSLIATTSLFMFSVARGTTTPAAGAISSLIIAFQAPSSGSVVIELRNAGSAATLSTDYILQYLVIN